MKSFSGILHIEPVPKGRPRLGRSGTYTPKKTYQYERAVRLMLRSCHQGREPLNGPVFCHLKFFLPRPSSVPKSRRDHSVKPDLDNLCKAFLDAAEKEIFTHDSRIVQLLLKKEYAENKERARVEYYFSEYDPDQIEVFLNLSFSPHQKG